MKKSKNKFELIYDVKVADHVRMIERKYHSFVRKKIEEQLFYDPGVESKNRKPMIRSTEIGANWELRFGPDNRFRVFYRVDMSEFKVYILAIGVKTGNRLIIGREEFQL